jgi:hypothetical protein
MTATGSWGSAVASGPPGDGAAYRRQAVEVLATRALERVWGAA